MKLKLWLGVAFGLICSARLYADNSVAVKIIGVQPLSNIQVRSGPEERETNFGVGGGLEYSKRILDRLALGAEFDWITRSERASTSLIPGSRTSISGDSKAFMIVPKFIIVPNKKFEPYIGFGLGIAQTRLKADIQPAPGFVWTVTRTNESRTVIDSQETSVAWSPRLGVEGHLGGGFSLGLELAIFGTGETTHNATESGRQVMGDFSITGRRTDFLMSFCVAYHFTH